MASEDAQQFELRKIDHLRIALDPKVQASEGSPFSRVQLIPEALPEIDLHQVDITQDCFGLKLGAPLFISSMTAGHAFGHEINCHLAKRAQEKKWLMGVGSQRRELQDPSARAEWKAVRQQAPRAVLYGNLGLSQLIQSSVDQVLLLADALEASGIFIHTNPLQEAIQTEGTPYFKGGLKALENLAVALDQKLKIPLVLKEVGSGFSEMTLQRVNGVGLAAVDLAGLGGTHWGRVETARASENAKAVGEAFRNWGLSTVDSMLGAHKLQQRGDIQYQVWASGGVRSGLDAAKLLAMGAQMVGLAQPLMAACLEDLQTGRDTLAQLMSNLENELRISLFCTGSIDLKSFRAKGVWNYV